MKSAARNPANTITGTIEPGPRGPILRDADGVRWRLSFVNGAASEGLSGRVSVRGKLAGPDLIEAEYVAPHDGDA